MTEQETGGIGESITLDQNGDVTEKKATKKKATKKKATKKKATGGIGESITLDQNGNVIEKSRGLASMQIRMAGDFLVLPRLIDRSTGREVLISVAVKKVKEPEAE